ncbi:hypothetical protein I3842_15G014400 [Carya illinoinensis]|uniref:Glycosyltransferase n=2 Tax=Carya illinoinensis TaxID=32201 RepID=A0A922A2Z3_CARIL|nr:hypothetical protein I3842_15G014400 [Carya illinoinensis]
MNGGSRGLKVTVITTPSNAPFIVSQTSNHPNISSAIIPFPRVEELPDGCENTADLPSMALWVPFLEATKKMKQSFERVLRDMIDDGRPPICVISDFLLGWTLDSCRLFGIPRIVSHGIGVFSMSISLYLISFSSCLNGLWGMVPIELPGMTLPFKLQKADIPEGIGEADMNSWGVIVNSFEELEGRDHVGRLESFYYNDAKAYCVGPSLLYNQPGQNLEADHDKSSYIKWLDKQAEMRFGRTVLYVSFGTQTHLSEDQLDEIANGLEMANHPFIWVVRSKTWAAPKGWNERVKQRGLVLRNWVDQRRILAHSATGGFLGHCGWNSTLESLTMGVPLLAWPMIGISEQALNAKFVVMGLGAGLMVPWTGVNGEKIMTVGRDVICDKVKELMGGENGRMAGERAQALEEWQGICGKRWVLL